MLSPIINPQHGTSTSSYLLFAFRSCHQKSHLLQTSFDILPTCFHSPKMPKYPSDDPLQAEQSQSLLQHSELDESNSRPLASSRPSRPAHHTSGRQSSFSKRAPNGTPRTPNRVRFDVHEPEYVETNSNTRTEVADEDLNGGFNHRQHIVENGSARASTGQRAPLLTGIEAPSVAIADELDFNAEDLLEDARPKSGIKSAFMNMANSIIGAGIIGQPYAFKQAGLLTGIILLVGLTVTVDWTIRLIVINSKLSGASSFQGTMEKCFGKPGLIAISIAQWAFAFGGMMAFCIIVGDTIPQVLAAIFPSLSKTPFLWIFTNRRAVIILFILGLSYPLSLYRDIAKVR